MTRSCGASTFSIAMPRFRYYITPMLEKGLIVRTDPNHPQSPQHEYSLA